MGFLDPSKLQEDDALPGGSGLHLDLDTKVCPACRREALPWQTECEDCGVATVVRAEMPVPQFELPHLQLDDADDAPTGETVAGETDAGETDAGETDAGETDAGPPED